MTQSVEVFFGDFFFVFLAHLYVNGHVLVRIPVVLDVQHVLAGGHVVVEDL